jgi:hypothetical protein
MRSLVAFLLCLSISLQGWAAGAGVQAPCPMGDMMVMQSSMAANGDIELTADLGGCCNDAATYAMTGKLCKTGQECQVPTAWMGSISPPVIQTQPSSVLLVIGSPTPPDGAPASVWRPPIL